MPDVIMPRLTDSMQEGAIASWIKADGDEVKRGEELVEIETDKATMAYEADFSGTLRILVAAGETVAVGTVIGQIGEAPPVVAGGPVAAAPVAAAPAGVGLWGRDGQRARLGQRGRRGATAPAQARCVAARSTDRRTARGRLGGCDRLRRVRADPQARRRRRGAASRPARRTRGRYHAPTTSCRR